MTVREEREAAFWLAWRKGIQFDPKRYLPGFLDDLEAIDDKSNEELAEAPQQPPDDQVAITPDEAAKANPAIPERVKPPTAARPAPRRRTRS